VTTSTLPSLLAKRVRETPGTAAFRPLDSGRAGSAVTWAEFASAADAVASALHHRGVRRGDRIGILARTCVEWEFAQMGALRLGAIVVGIDPNYADDTLRRLFQALRLAVVVVADAPMLARVPADVLKSVKLVVTLAGTAPLDGRSLSIDEALVAESGPLSMLPAPEGTDLAIVVFSSGTSGLPKPIAYTHQQVVHAVETIVAAFPDVAAGNSLLCWLPLANLFQRILNFCAIARGVTVFVLGDPRKVMDVLPVAAPRLLIGVPLFYERVYQGILQRVSSLAGMRGALARWGLGLLRRKADAALTSGDRMLAPLAERLVFRSLRGVFGARLEYLVSGSAPMPDSLLRWYDALGLPVYEAYGVSENVVPIALNHPGTRRLGSVGKPSAMNEVRVAADGEILVRGPGVFGGYLDQSEVDSRPAPDGFWPTGDLGALDADGYLSITGRKADVFKSPSGRWIAPARIEALLRGIPGVDEAVIVGAGRPVVIAIVGVNAQALGTAAGAARRDAAHLHAPAEADLRFLRDAVSATVAALPAEERPRALLVSTRAFSVSGGELTSNLKLRRHAIEEKLRTTIDDAYARLRAAKVPGREGEASPLVLLCA